jgi:hypothetical protein
MKKRSTPIPQRLRKLVRESFVRHARNIGVGHYTTDIHYMTADKPSQDDSSVAADITVNRRYLTAEIHIYPHGVQYWRRNGDAAMDRVIAHETSHIATQHLFDVAVATYRDEGEMKDAWETLTEVVAQLSLKVTPSPKTSSKR